MTISEVTRKCLCDYFSIRLESEHLKGPANTVDFLGISPEHGEIRVELEKRRADPVNNVVKAWRQAHESPDEPSFTMIHIFSGYYRGANISKFENARFVGERMAEYGEGCKIKYVTVSFGFEPPENPARLPEPDLSETVERQIYDEIHRQLETLLPISTRISVDNTRAPVAPVKREEPTNRQDRRMGMMNEDELVAKLEEMSASGDKTAMEALFGVVFHTEIARVSNAKRIADRAAGVKTNSNVNLGIRLASYVTANNEAAWKKT